MEQRIKLVEDFTGEDVSENHAKSVLVGILDPTTRQHTAMYHGNKSTCEDLKKVVLEFINNVTRRDDTAMQVGRVSAEEEEHGRFQPLGQAEDTSTACERTLSADSQ